MMTMELINLVICAAFLTVWVLAAGVLIRQH